MPKDLSQAHQIVGIVRKKLMGHRVSQQMRMDLEPTDRTVLVAQIPDSSIRQRPSFSNEGIG